MLRDFDQSEFFLLEFWSSWEFVNIALCPLWFSQIKFLSNVSDPSFLSNTSDSSSVDMDISTHITISCDSGSRLSSTPSPWLVLSVSGDFVSHSTTSWSLAGETVCAIKLFWLVGFVVESPAASQSSRVAVAATGMFWTDSVVDDLGRIVLPRTTFSSEASAVDTPLRACRVEKEQAWPTVIELGNDSEISISTVCKLSCKSQMASSWEISGGDAVFVKVREPVS